MMRYHTATLALVAALAIATPAAAGPAQFVIVNNNAAGIGLNDPTPAAPVGGNMGTTLGEQRMNALNRAAELWSARLDSTVPIRIRAQFVSLGAGVLGSAGPISVVRDFANAPLPGTWYHVALANKLAGVDLVPTNDDINVNFSSNFNFYLGLDNNHGTQPDLVTVLLHEFAHGLGFSQFASLGTGALFGGLPDVYNSHLFDSTLNLTWPQMLPAERAASATRFGRVVWTGANVTGGVPLVLLPGSPEVRVTSPAAIAGPFQFGTAAFGPALGSPDVFAPVVAAEMRSKSAGPRPMAAPPSRMPARSRGASWLIERGLCGFAVKARNATDAGAAAVIIYNNAANVNAGPPGMANDGINGPFVTVPTVSIRRIDGLAIVAQLAGGVTGSLAVDLTIRAGADPLDRARVFAPFPVAGGSSISHFDSVARRNLLMEPAINADLTHRLKAPDDLTFELLRDLGWTFPDADGDGVVDDEDCNPNSSLSATIVIGGRDTGVPTTLFPNGCTSADLIASIAAGAANHGAFVSGVAHLTNTWQADGLITGAQKGAVQNAAARANIP